MGYNTHHGDAVKWALEYSGPLFHALLCDAPYEMGFMGKDWDASGVAFDAITWEAFSRVLHPGAFLFVMAGTINDDLISVAMRKAGLRKFHKMMGWAYGSGFPKAQRIDTQIDKAAGAEREIVRPRTYKLANEGGYSGGLNTDKPRSESCEISLPATPLAQAWEGHRYGLQALKPAIETILIFQKPYEGKPIDDITWTGAGALNIEGGRIGIEEELPRYTPSKSGLGKHGIYAPSTREQGANSPTRYDSSGRWPSNFLLLDEEAARALDEQSAGTRASKPNTGANYSGARTDSVYLGGFKRTSARPNDPAEVPGASRFFFRVEEALDRADPVFYCAKASRGEREAGLGETGLKESSQRYGLTGSAEETGHGPHKHYKNFNSHPTVKPLSLCQHLATLLLPPIEYAPRRIFVPFAGVGSEMIGAVLAGWEEVEGVELTEEYIPINRARLDYWSKRPRISKKPKSSVPLNLKDPNQKELF